MHELILRDADFSLSDEHEAIEEAFAGFFAKECPPARVRKAEPLGFDAELWAQLVEMGVMTMGLPEAAGGDGAGVVELALVAEQLGRTIAPVPFIEAVTAARALVHLGGSTVDAGGDIDLSRLHTVALHPAASGASQLVPAGAIAQRVIGLDGDELVLVADSTAPDAASNHGASPLAWWTLSGAHDERRLLATGNDARNAFARYRLEWKLLMVAALIGLADATLAMAVEHARSREAFGAPIGAFQAVAHPLADIAIGVEGGRRLARKAAWYADHDEARATELGAMAFVQASELATNATRVGVHVLGGVGFTLEADIEMYFRRAKGWPLVAGGVAPEFQTLADALFGPGEEATDAEGGRS
jgi:alkylation response protein AidB-like acyl-CoA dehydrogenase